jgi:hypothetical protein
MPVTDARAQIDSVTEREMREAHRIRLELANRTGLDGRLQALAQPYLTVQAIVRPTLDKSYFAERHVPLDSFWFRTRSFEHGSLRGESSHAGPRMA